MPITERWDFKQFKEKFFQISGLNLDSYKDRQMERRIRTLLEREGCASQEQFINKLRQDPQARYKFLDYLTINTSGFFRDLKIFNYLQQYALVELLKRHERINLWSMGCSRGEEPYTLTIILSELSALGRADILASDLDDRVREFAREGCYAPNQLTHLPPLLLQKYFTAQNGVYSINERLKRSVRFEKHNFLTPIYQALPRMEMVLCRNVFIYFKTEVQEWIIGQVADMIVPGGYFVTGCAEFINNPQRFGLERKIPAVYQKQG